jgi:RNA polymerase sigma-54 factor
MHRQFVVSSLSHCRFNKLWYTSCMSLKISQLQTQRQVLAPVMQQSIEILMLPLLDLQTAITQELQNNPLLEIDEQKTIEKNQDIDLIVDRRLAHFSKSPTEYSSDRFKEQQDDEPEEKPFSRPPSLEEHLLRQLHIEVEDPDQLEIGEWIIGSLDEDGYLPYTLEEIAQLLKMEDCTKIEAVLKKIQRFDPVGIAARDLKECLLAQINGKTARGNSSGAMEGLMGLSERIVRDYLDDLGRKKYSDIARQLKVPVEHIKSIAKEISGLEPRPARSFSSPAPHIYVKPDIIIRKAKEGHEIVINNEQLPVLRVNVAYQNMLKNPNLKDDEKEFIREKIKGALFFMRSIEQRHKTIRGIVEYIVRRQNDFWEQGHVALKPMGLKDVAEAVGRNESTISRAIHQKYVDTPQGIFPLKYFFSQAVSDTDENAVTNRSVQEEIRGIIMEESKAKPLSDRDIQAILKDRGMDVARRTIAKYRNALYILPAYLRKC